MKELFMGETTSDTLAPYIMEQLWLSLADEELDRLVNFVGWCFIWATLVLYAVLCVLALYLGKDSYTLGTVILAIPMTLPFALRWRLRWNARLNLRNKTSANAAALCALVGTPPEVWKPVAEDLSIHCMPEHKALREALHRLPRYAQRYLERRFEARAEAVVAPIVATVRM